MCILQYICGNSDHVLSCKAGEAGSIRKSLMREITRELLDCVDDKIKKSSLVSKQDGFEPCGQSKLWMRC